MTSKLTIEQAKRLRNDFECWQQDYDPKDDKEQYDMFGRGMAAMDMLIAGMYQEPVAYIGKQWTLVYYTPPMSMGLKIGDKLYRHAQQPVVPPMQHWEELCREHPDMSIGDAIIRAAWWNHCRAAMLQSGNSPAQNPGWIPVSERLPEVGGRYWCYVEEQNSLGKSHYQWNCSWNGEIWGGAMMYGRVTHWMPLPAAPQEVNHG